MSSLLNGPMRRFLPAAVVLILTGALFLLAKLPSTSDDDRKELASRFRFTELPIAMPPNLPEHRTVRAVNPAYEEIRSWISSVGAAIALNDLEGTGVANGLCLVDTRSDSVVVTAAPGSKSKIVPFVLQPAPLPYDATMAPMGCVPGDYNGDGRMDLLVYYWGRTPVLFLHKPVAGPLTLASYRPTELIPQQSRAVDHYTGERWNTNAVAVADFDGDGHPDIGVFNYFPDSGVLDPTDQDNVTMNHSMSRAQNGGGAHVLCWMGEDANGVIYTEEHAIDPAVATGWTLGAASADLDGDLLPELYLANDFGNDRFFHNVSTKGHIRFELAEGTRGPFTAKSAVVGHDSFKGMSIEFGDLGNTGKFDMFVSNITTCLLYTSDAADE